MPQPAGRTRRPHGRKAAVAAALGLALAVLSAGACATIGQILGIQEPTFAVASGHASTLRLGAPSIVHPRGTATMQVWAHVSNPNPFGLTLSTFRGKLALQGRDLIDVDLPLGLPMSAVADTVIPLDLTFGFESLSALGSVANAVLTHDAVSYELNGTLGVRAGSLGEPTFGPHTWLSGSVQVQNPLRIGLTR